MGAWFLVLIFSSQNTAISVPQASQAVCTQNAKWAEQQKGIAYGYCIPTGYTQ